MVPLTICFAAGILADRLGDFHGSGILSATILIWVGWFAILWKAPGKTNFACALLFLMIFFSGALWHHARWNWHPKDSISLTTGADINTCAVRGIVRTEPVRVAAHPAHPTLDTLSPRDRVRFLLKVESIRAGQEWNRASGVVRTSVLLSDAESNNSGPVALPSSGESVEIAGNISHGNKTKNPGQFDFREHFRSRGELTTLFVGSTDGIKYLDFQIRVPGRRAKIRAWIDEQLHIHLPQEQAAFASAVLLGNRDQMDLEVRDRFLKTGASHLLAISGLHVGILASAFLLLLKLGFVSRRNCLYCTIFFVLGYAWLVEFRPTVLRASILICVMCGARLLGKTALSWGSLTAALMLVLIANPNDLFSIGAQLSFLAISTIIIGKPWIFQATSTDPLDQLIAQTRPAPVRAMNQLGRNIRAACCVSFLIWIMGIPLVAYRFHSIALVSPLINPMLLLPLAMALYAGIVLVCCSCILPSAAVIPAFVCSTSLASIQTMIDFGSDQPIGHFWSAGPSGLAVLAFYIGVFLFAVFPKTKLPTRWCVLLATGWLIFGWLVPERVARLKHDNRNKLEVTVIDVRHGSATLVSLPDGKNLLFDCGSLSGSRRAATTISNVLWKEGIHRLDAVVISHADVDHFNALPELLDRFDVREVWTTEPMANSDAASVATLLEAMTNHNVPLRLAGTGSSVHLTHGSKSDEVVIEFLGPPKLPAALSKRNIGDNEMSLIASLRW